MKWKNWANVRLWASGDAKPWAWPTCWATKCPLSFVSTPSTNLKLKSREPYTIQTEVSKAQRITLNGNKLLHRHVGHDNNDHRATAASLLPSSVSPGLSAPLLPRVVFVMCLQKLPRRFTPDDTSPMLFLITTYRLRSSLLPCETREHENTLSTILCFLRAAKLVILSLPSHSGRLPSFPRQEPFPCMSAIGARAFTLRSKGDFPAHTRLTSPGPSGLTSNPCCVRTKRLFWSPLLLTSACSALQILRGTRHTRAHIRHTHTPHQMQFSCLNCAVNRPTSKSHYQHPRRCFMSGHIARSRCTNGALTKKDHFTRQPTSAPRAQ